MKSCIQCNIKKEFDKFYTRKDSTKYQNKCKECMDNNYKLYYKNNKEKILNQQQTISKNLRISQNNYRKYKITNDIWNEMFSNQNFSCAICKTKEFKGKGSKPHIDHCHKTGKIRGLLCTNCNHGIGQFKDNLELLQEAINYLKNNA